MFNSKALKGGFNGKYDDEDPNPNHGKFKRFLYKIKHFIKWEILYKIEGLYYRYKERIGRSLAFARFGWLNYDFDASTLYDLMAFKLKRVHAALLVGHAVQEDEDMDALKEAIALCERLYNERYEHKYNEEHDKKWGEIESEHIPIPDKDGKVRTYEWRSSRKGANTPELKEKERKEFMLCFENAEKDKHNDINKLAEIFKKYLNRWWD